MMASPTGKQRYKKFYVILIFISLTLIIGSLGLVIYQALNPPDRIKVTTSQLPPDTVFISFISESNGIQQNMDWYPKGEIGIPFTMRPSRCVWSSLEYKEPPKIIDWDAYVKWQWGERYGLVTRNKGGKWKVTWFKAKDLTITRHWPIIGNGEAFFDLNKGVTIDMPNDKVRALGLHEFFE